MLGIKYNVFRKAQSFPLLRYWYRRAVHFDERSGLLTAGLPLTVTLFAAITVTTIILDRQLEMRDPGLAVNQGLSHPMARSEPAHFWNSVSRLGGLVAVLACVPRKSLHSRRESKRQRAVQLAASEDTEGADTSESDLGLDFSKLRSLLEQQDFKAADAETRSLLIKMAGDEAVKRGWVYFAEVKIMPEKDMDTLETLWQQNSNGRFGFVQQRKIWRKVRGQFDKFAEEVSWFTDTWKNRNWPDEFIYNVEAPVGHLPLTNCIRGAQVLEELLNHPAIQNKKAAAIKKSKPSTSESGDEKPGRRSALSMLAQGPTATKSPPRAILAGGQAPRLPVAREAGRF